MRKTRLSRTRKRYSSNQKSALSETDETLFLNCLGGSPILRIVDFFLDNPLSDYSKNEIATCLCFPGFIPAILKSSAKRDFNPASQPIGKSGCVDGTIELSRDVFKP